MGVCSNQPLAKSKGVHREMESEGSWRQNSDQGTRTSLGIGYGMSLLNKTKSNLLHRRTSVDDVGTWNESESSYRGRSHGREEITLNHG